MMDFVFLVYTSVFYKGTNRIYDNIKIANLLTRSHFKHHKDCATLSLSQIIL